MGIVNNKEPKMSKLLITTQVYENYAWREDGSLGTGADAYWKAKGGSDYVVLNIDINDAAKIAEMVRPQIECDNDAFREYIIGWEVVADDYLTEFERSQLEYDGEITYPAREISVDKLAA
jgi:hypothetical protein